MVMFHLTVSPQSDTTISKRCAHSRYKVHGNNVPRSSRLISRSLWFLNIENITPLCYVSVHAELRYSIVVQPVHAFLLRCVQMNTHIHTSDETSLAEASSQESITDQRLREITVDYSNLKRRRCGNNITTKRLVLLHSAVRRGELKHMFN